MSGDSAYTEDVGRAEAAGERRAKGAQRSVLHNTASALSLRALTAAFVAIGAVILARYLGPEGRGLVATATAGPLITVLLLVVGLSVSNVYFIAREEVSVSGALGTSMAVGGGLGSAAALVYVGVALVLQDSTLRGLPTPYIVVGALLVPASLTARYVASIAQGLQRIALLNSVGLLQAVATVLLSLVLLVGLRAGPLVALAIAVGSVLVSVTPVLIVLTKDYGRWHFERGYVARSVRFAAKGEAGNFITFLGYRLDLIIVTALLGFGASGHYFVAFTAVELLWMVPNAIATVLFPRVAASVAMGAHPSIESSTALARLTTLLLVGFAIIGGILAPLVVPLVFSAEYSASILPLELLIPGVVLFGVGKVLTADLSGRGHPGVSTVAVAVAVVVMVALDMILIPAYGLPGAGAASSISYAVAFVIQAVIFKRITGTPVGSVLVARRSDIAQMRSAAAQALLRLRGYRGRPVVRGAVDG